MRNRRFPIEQLTERFVELGKQYAAVIAQLRRANSQAQRAELYQKLRLFGLEAQSIGSEYRAVVADFRARITAP
jgi:hypothetical protein